MEIFFDEVRVVRISDEAQLAELEFSEAQEDFCSAACRWHDTKHQDSMEKMTECEVKLLNAFFAGDPNPMLRKAWAAYRRRLLFKHGCET
jgi:hypothetical protein